MTNKIFEVEFDGRGTYTLGELVSEGFFGEDGHELTMTEVDSMAVGQSLHFAGGAAPLGTIMRLGCGFQAFGFMPPCTLNPGHKGDHEDGFGGHYGRTDGKELVRVAGSKELRYERKDA